MTKSDLKNTGKISGALAGNPIPDILNLLDWQYRVVGPRLLDDLRILLAKRTKPFEWFSDSYIMLLLIHLRDAGLVELLDVTLKGVTDSITVIKKI